MTTIGDARPPTILGEFGEGYCRVCHFVEPLDVKGLLANHFTGFSSAADLDAYRCKGAGTKPPKLTPHRSKLASFSSTPPYGECPVCHARVYITSIKVMGRHREANEGILWCAGVGRPPATAAPGPGKDHSNERG